MTRLYDLCITFCLTSVICMCLDYLESQGWSYCYFYWIALVGAGIGFTIHVYTIFLQTKAYINGEHP